MNRSNDRSFERANIIALWHCGGDTGALLLLLLLLLLLPGRYGYGYRTATRGTTHPPQGRARQGRAPPRGLHPSRAAAALLAERHGNGTALRCTHQQQQGGVRLIFAAVA